MRLLPDYPCPADVAFGASISELEGVARSLRYQVVQMSHNAGTPHLGSSLSCIDVLVAAYWRILNVDPKNPGSPDRDRFILSKGHAAPALYVSLASRGFFPVEWLDSFAAKEGHLPEQPAPGCAPGVELATGSLGHGLPVGCGFALAGQIQKRDYRTVVVVSDGECNEGTVWEAAMFAAARKLGNLTVIVDYNKWQATGRSDEVLALAPLRDKWSAFGWSADEVDGHSLPDLVQALSGKSSAVGRPRAIIAHTVKGKGVPFMEDDNNWHYRIPKPEEVDQVATILNQP